MIEQNNLKLDKNIPLNNSRREFDEDELADFDSLFEAGDDADYDDMSVEAGEPDLGDFPLEDVNDVFSGGESVEAGESDSVMTASEAESLENLVSERIREEVDNHVIEKETILKEISKNLVETEVNVNTCEKALEGGVTTPDIKKLEQIFSLENREKLVGENAELMTKGLAPFFEDERKKHSDQILEVKELYNEFKNLRNDLQEDIKNIKNIQEYYENLQEKSVNNIEKEEILKIKEDIEEKYNELHDFSEEYKEICEENKNLLDEIDNLKNELEESKNSISALNERARADEEEKECLRSQLEVKNKEYNRKMDDALANLKDMEKYNENMKKSYDKREKKVETMIYLLEVFIGSVGVLIFVIATVFNFGEQIGWFRNILNVLSALFVFGPFIREGLILWRK